MTESNHKTPRLTDSLRRYLNGELYVPSVGEPDGENQITEEYAQTLQTRLRDWAIPTIANLAEAHAKAHELGLGNENQLARRGVERDEFKQNLTLLVALVWRTAETMSGVDPERLIESGVEAGSFHPLLENVTVDLEYKDRFDLGRFVERLEANELPPLADVGEFLASGHGEWEIPGDPDDPDDPPETATERVLRLLDEAEEGEDFNSRDIFY